MVTKRRLLISTFPWLIQLTVGFLGDYGAAQPQRPQLSSYRPATPHYPDQHPPAAAAAAYRCSGKLEDALDNMVHRNQMKTGSRRTQIELTPYSIYHSLYGNSDKLDNVEDAFEDEPVGRRYSDDAERRRRRRLQHASAAIDKIEVAELRVRLPANTKRWVVVDKCQFSAPNRTLDTRLLFPDLTISGRVILHPSRGHCNMILRLRRAGIEFRTTPLDSRRYGESRVGTASVRTDSHFAEPGFLSVFAHGCQGPSGVKYRQNSKRNRFDRVGGMNGLDSSGETTTTTTYNRRTDERNSDAANEIDALNFDDDILDGVVDSNGEFPSNYGRSNFAQLFASSSSSNPNRVRPPSSSNGGWPSDSDEIGDSLSRELEQLFSVGIRGLLTTYMQKTLQPAIKETLMENMGYVLSYG